MPDIWGHLVKLQSHCSLPLYHHFSKKITEASKLTELENDVANNQRNIFFFFQSLPFLQVGFWVCRKILTFTEKCPLWLVINLLYAFTCVLGNRNSNLLHYSIVSYDSKYVVLIRFVFLPQQNLKMKQGQSDK